MEPICYKICVARCLVQHQCETSVCDLSHLRFHSRWDTIVIAQELVECSSRRYPVEKNISKCKMCRLLTFQSQRKGSYTSNKSVEEYLELHRLRWVTHILQDLHIFNSSDFEVAFGKTLYRWKAALNRHASPAKSAKSGFADADKSLPDRKLDQFLSQLLSPA